MDNLRVVLYIALVLIVMQIWVAWQEEKGAPRAPVTTAPAATAPAERGVPPAPPVASALAPSPRAPETVERAQRIEAVTDLVRAVIDTQGGDLRGLYLLKHPVAADKPEQPFPLMSDSGAELYIAQSGLIGHEAQLPTHKTRYRAEQARYTLAAGKNELRVPLTWQAPDGVRYTKTYVFHRDSYVVDVEFTVANTTRREWNGYFYGQFVRAHAEAGGMFALPTFTGGAIYTPEDKYQKLPFSDMASKPLKREVSGGWVAVLQHYFVGAWMPGAQERSQFYTDVQEGPRYVIGYKTLAPQRIGPGQTGIVRASIYAGPKEQKRLKQLVAGMDLTVDYGWLTVLSAPLFWLLDRIHGFIGNWGWAIVLVTFLIKLAFYPLSAASYKSMAQMKKLQPRLLALKERYGDDKQKLNQAMMELYKTEKINPLGGCLPILIQIPVFLALYWVLLESVEMRQAPWILWIKDLSAQDPYYVLPVIMGATMYLQMLLNPQPVDPIQKKVFMFMPLFMMVFFLFFPSGLVLYWTVNNVLSIAQQWQINRTIGAAYK